MFQDVRYESATVVEYDRLSPHAKVVYDSASLAEAVQVDVTSLTALPELELDPATLGLIPNLLSIFALFIREERNRSAENVRAPPVPPPPFCWLMPRHLIGYKILFFQLKARALKVLDVLLRHDSSISAFIEVSFWSMLNLCLSTLARSELINTDPVRIDSRIDMAGLATDIESKT
jgi:hypothetical protein